MHNLASKTHLIQIQRLEHMAVNLVTPLINGSVAEGDAIMPSGAAEDILVICLHKFLSCLSNKHHLLWP